MKTVFDHIRDHILSDNLLPDIESLEKSEWSLEFERLMRNRLIQGAFRYGLIGASAKPEFDRIECLIRRAKQYRETGNIECLVDTANLALLEFVEGKHPNKHLRSVDDGTHTEKVK